MTHAGRFVAVIAVLTALALCVPVQAQTRFVDALRARAEAGDAEAQYNLGVMYGTGAGVPQETMCRRTCGPTSRPHERPVRRETGLSRLATKLQT